MGTALSPPKSSLITREFLPLLVSSKLVLLAPELTLMVLPASPNSTGMNGDEDLGEDIQMKGEPFHFNQQLAQFATGMNGDEDLGEDIQMKGEPFHFTQHL